MDSAKSITVTIVILLSVSQLTDVAWIPYDATVVGKFRYTWPAVITFQRC